MLPGTPKFDTYLKFVSMGIGQMIQPLSPLHLHRNPQHFSLNNLQQHKHNSSKLPPTKEHG